MSEPSKTPPVAKVAEANAAAVTAKTEAAPAAPKAEPAKAPAAKVADPVIAPKAAPTPAPAAKSEPAAPAAKPAPVATKPAPAVKAPAPVAAPKMAKPAAKPAKPKATIKTSAVKASPVAIKAAAPAPKKETKMTTTETITAETKKAAEAMTDRVKALMGDMSTRAKTAYEKGTEMASQATEFSKGNVEALVESGKIAAKGVQEMGKTYAEDTKSTFEELTAAMKEMTTVKSPTEFIELQTKLVKKSFDTAMAQTSKNSEAFLKLAGDVFQPISNRVSVAVDSFKKAA